MAMSPLIRPSVGVSVAPTMQRRNRYPQHPFYVRHQAFEIQPFLLAPVLPGETMKNALFQSRAVTDPILDPLVGWWLEFYFFYVKHRDLVSADNNNLAVDLQEMMLDVNKSMAAHDAAADNAYNHSNASKPNYVKHALIRVVEEYFRDEGEAWNDSVNADSGLPVASIGTQSALQSAMAASEVTSADVAITVGVDDQITASEIEAAQREYEFMRLQGITNMSYEDYLASYGIRTRQAEEHRPELLRFVREWTYPTNTIDPTNGTPRSACSWAITERISKPRLFREPGWILGLTVARPKVYLNRLRGLVAHEMDDAFSWLPAALMGEKSHSLKTFAAGTGPVPSATVDYVIDMRDLFLYGEQFINLDQATVTMPQVNLPTAAFGTTRYPPEAQLDALFVAAANNKVKQDGIVSLTIAGMQADLTPGNRV